MEGTTVTSTPVPTSGVTDVVVEKVVVHPLVLLSVVDHFNRMGKIGSHKRVVGLLLGSWSSKGVLDVSNSFASESKTVESSTWLIN